MLLQLPPNWAKSILLVAGSGASTVVESAKQVADVEKVLVADAAHYAEGLAEELAPLVVKLAADYRYVAATATTFGKKPFASRSGLIRRTANF